MRVLACAALLVAGCYDFSIFDHLDGGAPDAAIADLEVAPDFALPDLVPPGRIDMALSLADPVQFEGGGNVIGIDTGDFNGDGNLDLLAGHASGATTVSILLGDGKGKLAFPVGYGGNHPVFGVRARDVDRDGKLDALAVIGNPDNVLAFFPNNGDGTLGAMKTTPLGNGDFEGFDVGDLDGDGNLDAVACEYAGNSLQVLRGIGDGTFMLSQSLTVGSHPSHAVLADLDGDGKLDVGVTNLDGEIMIALGNGNCTFQGALLITGSPFNDLASFAIAAGDLDGDNLLDLVVTENAVGARLWVFLNMGSGFFGQGMANLSGGDYSDGVALADFNGDGILDIADTNFGTCCVNNGVAPGHLSLLDGVGKGMFVAPFSFPPAGAPADNVHTLAVGDFDRDGRPDVAISTRTYGQILLYLNH